MESFTGFGLPDSDNDEDVDAAAATRVASRLRAVELVTGVLEMFDRVDCATFASCLDEAGLNMVSGLIKYIG
jgi:hypothetical protein